MGVVEKWYKQIKTKFEDRFKYSTYETLIMLGCIFTSVVMLLRVFYGTEITDEAYYISDAIQMVRGNLPYAYNNFSYGTGSAFLIIPLVFIYNLIIPSNEGVFLFTRICFILFWNLCIWISYMELKKDFKRENVLLISGLLIPYVAGVGIFNFSYNSIPAALAYVGGVTIYDAIEHKNKWTKLKLVVSGFVLGIALFAHLGYVVAIGILGLTVLIRSERLKDKVCNLVCCLVGGLLEILVVMLPIAIQAGFKTLYKGIYDKLNPYPSSAMSSTTVDTKVIEIMWAFGPMVIILLVVFAIAFVFSKRYIEKENNKIGNKEYVCISFITGLFALLLFVSARNLGNNLNWNLGMVGVIAIIIVLILGMWKEYPLFWYVGIYPVVFSFAQILSVDSNMSCSRFVASIPALAIALLIFLENKSELVCWLTTCCIGICILTMGVSDYLYVYRDEEVWNLDYKVEAGVYKGLYTTEMRAHDLPELEEYLNSIIGEDERYAFRDNVPAAYLMMKNGVMIDKSTWDCLNYSYHKNAPDTLYAYYQRRGDFPRKYIYVDFGRDKNLSIEDEDYKLNEFINTYYEKTEDFTLNETFYHVVVYEYKGGFDGDFDYWIEKHMWSPEEN